jgi:tetratricopeptide (TPR) repeat protein
VPGRFVVHDLLRAYAAGLARTSGSDLRAALGRLLSYLLHAAAGAALALNPQRLPIPLPPALPGAESEVFGNDVQALSWLEGEYEVLLAAIGRAGQEGLDVYVWQLPWALADLLAQQGHWPDWVRLQRGAAAAAQRSGDRASQAITLRSLGQATATTGDYNLARAHLSEALEHYRDLGDPAGQAQLHGDLSVVYGLQDEYPKALHHARLALGISRDAGLPQQAYAMNSIGWYHAQFGDYQEALASCQQALTLHREFASTFGEATTLDSIGYAHYHLGDHRQAIDHYQQAADLHARLGSRWQLTQTLTRLGDAHLAADNRSAAAAAWRQALALLEDLDHPDAGSIRHKLNGLRLAAAGHAAVLCKGPEASPVSTS